MNHNFYEMAEFRVFISRLSNNEAVALDIPSDELLALNDVSAIYVYCSSDLGVYYIGQTNAFLRRHDEHLHEEIEVESLFLKQKYEKYFGGGKVLIFYGEKVSGNLDYIEQRLIKIFKELRIIYNFKILNLPDGNRSDLIQIKRETIDNVIFEMLKLMSNMHVVKFSSDQMSTSTFNSILYRNSPFFELEDKQIEIMNSVMLPHYWERIRSRRSKSFKNPYSLKKKKSKNKTEHVKHARRGKVFIIRGGAGTGKTVLMNNIIAQLLGVNISRRKNSLHPPIRIGVCLKTNMRDYTRDIFKTYGKNLNDYGLYIGNWMDILREAQLERFDYIVVDESQRLLKYKKDLFPPQAKKFLEKYKKKDVLNLILDSSDKVLLFYDDTQTIRANDIDPIGDKGSYNKIYNFLKHPIKLDETLSVQYRIKINTDYKRYNKNYSNNYINYIKYMLGISEKVPKNLDFLNTSYFKIVTTLTELKNYTDGKKKIFPFKTSRIISGYSRPNNYVWKELNNMSWNTNHYKWSTHEKYSNEVGSIHAIQGYDMDYIGLIVGKDIMYDSENEKIICNKNLYYDVKGKAKLNDEELLKFVKNIYYVLFTRGIYGIRVYFDDPDFRKYWVEKTEDLKNRSDSQ